METDVFTLYNFTVWGDYVSRKYCSPRGLENSSRFHTSLPILAYSLSHTPVTANTLVCTTLTVLNPTHTSDSHISVNALTQDAYTRGLHSHFSPSHETPTTLSLLSILSAPQKWRMETAVSTLYNFTVWGHYHHELFSTMLRYVRHHRGDVYTKSSWWRRAIHRTRLAQLRLFLLYEVGRGVRSPRTYLDVAPEGR